MVLGLLALGLALGMYISGFLCQFHLRLVANANAVFSGIWALISQSLQKGNFVKFRGKIGKMP